MIVGRTRAGAAAVNLAADRVRVAHVAIDQVVHLSHLAAYLDGGGANPGAALIRGLIYGAGDALVARSEEVAIPDGTPPAWVPFRFANAGLALPAGDYSIGIHVGGVTNCARTYVDDPGTGGSRQAVDPYADGTAAALPAPAALTANLAAYLSVFQPWVVPEVGDDALARLPWDLAQRALGASGRLEGSRTGASAGWHGTLFDEETGAFAVVRSDGPLAELVGERIRVTNRVGTLERSAIVYVHNEIAFPEEIADEDISLTRRAFLALGPWWAETLEVVVETLA